MGISTAPRHFLHLQSLYWSSSESFSTYFSGSLPRLKIAEFKFWDRVYLKEIRFYSRKSSDRNPPIFWMEELLFIFQDSGDWKGEKMLILKSLHAGKEIIIAGQTPSQSLTKLCSLQEGTVFYSYFYCSTVLRLDGNFPA